MHEGRRIVYVDVGEGDAILLAHGRACEHADWRRQLGQLSKNFRVIAADEPFCGASDPGPLPPNIGQTAAALWALLDHADVGRVVLVGHSGGASTCRAMYRMHPGRVRAFVSVDSSTGGKISHSILKTHPQVLSPEQESQWERNREELKELGKSGDYPSDANLICLRRFKHGKRVRAVKTQGMDEVAKTDPSERKWCKVPLLLFTAGRGRMGQEDLGPDWLEKNAAGEQARVIVIRESGHWLMYEAPDIFNRELTQFVEAIGLSDHKHTSIPSNCE
jgi:pimeloyl-ACP methyl ester carboxylesterase